VYRLRDQRKLLQIFRRSPHPRQLPHLRLSCQPYLQVLHRPYYLPSPHLRILPNYAVCLSLRHPMNLVVLPFLREIMLCRVFSGMGSYNGLILIMVLVFSSLMMIGYLLHGCFKATMEWTSWLSLMMVPMDILTQFKSFLMARIGCCFIGAIIFKRGIPQLRLRYYAWTLFPPRAYHHLHRQLCHLISLRNFQAQCHRLCQVPLQVQCHQ